MLVHINNVSAANGQILTNLLGQKFLAATIIVGNIFFDKTSFLDFHSLKLAKVIK